MIPNGFRNSGRLDSFDEGGKTILENGIDISSSFEIRLFSPIQQKCRACTGTDEHANRRPSIRAMDAGCSFIDRFKLQLQNLEEMSERSSPHREEDE